MNATPLVFPHLAPYSMVASAFLSGLEQTYDAKTTTEGAAKFANGVMCDFVTSSVTATLFGPTIQSAANNFSSASATYLDKNGAFNRISSDVFRGLVSADDVKQFYEESAKRVSEEMLESSVG